MSVVVTPLIFTLSSRSICTYFSGIQPESG